MTAPYRILRDYGAYEGMRLEERKFDTVDEAVKAALGGHTPFLIVNVVEWEARARQAPEQAAAPVIDDMAGVIEDAVARFEAANRQLPKDLQYGGVTVTNAVNTTSALPRDCPDCGTPFGTLHEATCPRLPPGAPFSGISG